MERAIVTGEREGDRCWIFDVAVGDDRRTAVHHRVSLSWVDYDHWCHGRLPPERVAAALVGLLHENRGRAGVPEQIPERFDASTARRWWPGIGRAMGALL